MVENMFQKFLFKNKNFLQNEKSDNFKNNSNSKINLRDIHNGDMEIKSYIQIPGKPTWSNRNYNKFAEEGYIKNVVANRCITLISKGASGVPINLFKINKNGDKTKIKEHKLLNLLKKPNLLRNGSEFMEEIYSYKLISGNAFIQIVGGGEGEYDAEPEELYNLRPDRVSIIPGSTGIPIGYSYRVNKKEKKFYINNLTGRSKILHLRNFHPLDDLYGLSPIESAAYSIDQHNESSKWNQSMLQNGARPSGALIVKMTSTNNLLTKEQFDRLKIQIENEFSGSANAGRPLLLEGGLEWKEMSLSPRDMDFLNTKHSAARDIAIAFGVPSQLLGIPGDDTYNNLAEARLSLWEQTILPIMKNVLNALNGWLTPLFGDDLKLEYDIDSIEALSLRRETTWNRINNASFLTDDEKREILGL